MTTEPNPSQAPGQPEDGSSNLDAVLDGAEQKGLKIAKVGRKLTKAGQDLADLAAATRQVVHIVKAPPNVEFLISDWQTADEQAGIVLAQAEAVLAPQFSSATGTAAVTSSDLVNNPALFGIVAADQHPQLLGAIANLNRVLSRSADAQEVAGIMAELGLDRAPPGGEAPLGLFMTAHHAYENPVSGDDPASTSLIPLRESIHASIECLLKRRRRQEEAKREWDKVQSIGRQLKRSGTPDSQVDSWAFQWASQLKLALSPSKQESITRDEWGIRLVRGTLFLKAFLGGLDPAKLR